MGEPVLTDSLVDARTLERSEFLSDYLNRLDIYRACTVWLTRNERGAQGESRLCIYRSRSQAPFDEHAVNLMALLVPHLRRAQRIQQMLGEREHQAMSAMTTLDCLSMGVVFLTRDGNVTYLNPSAHFIAAQRDGLVVVSGRLRAARDKDSQRLDRLVVDASARGKSVRAGGSMQIVRPSGKRAMQLVVWPLPKADDSLRNGRKMAAAAVFICGHERQMTHAPELLSHLYELSPAETRLAAALLEGKTLTQSAEDAGVSVNTTKTQLASLFAKTGTHRQAELLPALIAAVGNVRTMG